MPIRLIFVVLIIVLLATFIVVNIENRCSISFAVRTFQDIPVVVTILSAFALGLITSLPFALCRRRPKDSVAKTPRKRRGKGAAADAAKDERFPDGGAEVP